MARRSELSSNWRVKLDIPTNTDSSTTRSEYKNNDARPIVPGRRDAPRQVPAASSEMTENARGEDDPQTLRAIEEGRRLYVGNLPYMAKMKDVEWLFLSNGYQM